MPAVKENHGGNSIVKTISSLPPDLLTETCLEILTYLEGKQSVVDPAKVSLIFHRHGLDLNYSVVEAIAEYLMITFRSNVRSNSSADDFVTTLENSSTDWSIPSLQVLHKLWGEHGALVHSAYRAKCLGIDKLVEIDWKLGMSVSSDTCRSLNSPYVTLQLKIVEPSGQICHKSFEMTIPQFQNFHKQFKEIAAVMETV